MNVHKLSMPPLSTNANPNPIRIEIHEKLTMKANPLFKGFSFSLVALRVCGQSNRLVWGGEYREGVAETVEGARLAPRDDHLRAKIGHGRFQLGGGHRERRRGEGVRHRR